jgi:hypothetical protein
MEKDLFLGRNVKYKEKHKIDESQKHHIKKEDRVHMA